MLVRIQVIKDVSPFRPVRLPSSSGPTVKDALRSTETSVTLHQSTGRNLQLLCENVMSRRIEDRAGPSELCMTHLLRICEDHCHIHKGPILGIFHSVPYDILKLWLTPMIAQFYSLCILSITCRS